MTDVDFVYRRSRLGGGIPSKDKPVWPPVDPEASALAMGKTQKQIAAEKAVVDEEEKDETRKRGGRPVGKSMLELACEELKLRHASPSCKLLYSSRIFLLFWTSYLSVVVCVRP
jgi:hypothetical protein